MNTEQIKLDIAQQNKENTDLKIEMAKLIEERASLAKKVAEYRKLIDSLRSQLEEKESRAQGLLRKNGKLVSELAKMEGEKPDLAKIKQQIIQAVNHALSE